MLLVQPLLKNTINYLRLQQKIRLNPDAFWPEREESCNLSGKQAFQTTASLMRGKKKQVI